MSKPDWCRHRATCRFIRSVSDSACGGRLPKPEPHDGDVNTHRICIRTNADVFDLQVNRTDLWWLSELIGSIREDMDNGQA